MKERLITDRDTGRSRGFAFIEMADSAEAERGISALNGMALDDRTLNVNEARPKAGSDGRFTSARGRRDPRW